MPYKAPTEETIARLKEAAKRTHRPIKIPEKYREKLQLLGLYWLASFYRLRRQDKR